MAHFHHLAVGDWVRVLSSKDMAHTYEFMNMDEGEMKTRMRQIMRERSSQYADKIGRIEQKEGDVVRMDHHLGGKWFYDWMLLPTEARPAEPEE